MGADLGAPIKLLIVEDSPDDIELLVQHIKRSGYDPIYERVETANSMAEALERVAWDMVLCDYHLPTFGALSALSISKSRKPNTPFIIVSGSVSEEDAVLALKAGANDYVLKHNLTRLIPAIEREINEARNGRERVRIEAELKKTEQELRQAQKLEAVGQLAGGIAHDFNNILAIMQIQTDLLIETVSAKDPVESKEKIKKGLEQLKKTGERAANLTRQLLAFSRKQLLQPQVINLNEFLPDIKKMLSRVVEENVEFNLALGQDLKSIKADPGHLEQVLMNLVVNGRDAMPKGGVLTIQTQNCRLEEAFVGRYGLTAGNYVLLTVSDTGEGMPEEVKNRIFEPFFTTKEIGKGTGLGLSTVYGIVKQNRGLIFVESQLTKGTTFKIYFPEAIGGPASTVSPLRKINDFQGTETVLVVEDDDVLRELVCAALTDRGYKVLSASNGTDAIPVLEKKGKDVQLILTDVVMPKMGGVEFASIVQKKDPNIRVLFLSGYTESVLVQQGMSAGNFFFLAKPYSIRILLERVRGILESTSRDSVQ